MSPHTIQTMSELDEQRRPQQTQYQQQQQQPQHSSTPVDDLTSTTDIYDDPRQYYPGLSADLLSQFAMPMSSYVPLPPDAPLPPASFTSMPFNVHDMPAYYSSQPQTAASHPLFDGISGMHYYLGHNSHNHTHNHNWPDFTDRDQPESGVQNHSQYYQQQHEYQVPSTSTSTQFTQRPSVSRGFSESSLSTWHSDSTEREIYTPTSPSAPMSPSTSVAVQPPLPGPSKYSEPAVTSKTDANTQKQKSSPREKSDPYAPSFIKEQLGDYKWSIFTSRLAENRRNGSRARKNKALADNDSDSSDSASSIDFLVKVEVVKWVLRTFVPHPYNPLKSRSHSYPDSPSGEVTLSRAAVLALSGWSNTQFAYWARRSEGISVLAPYDRPLSTIASILFRRLRDSALLEAFCTDPSYSYPQNSSQSNPPSESSTPPSPGTSTIFSVDEDVADGGSSNDGGSPELDADPEKWVRNYVTGKGLDSMIQKVSKRTGVSQFLRGKHSSLDAFGTNLNAGNDSSGAGATSENPSSSSHLGQSHVDPTTLPKVYMPTFQAEMYVHEMPSVPSSLAVSSGMMDTESLGKRKAPAPLNARILTGEAPSWVVEESSTTSSGSEEVRVLVKIPETKKILTQNISTTSTSKSPADTSSPTYAFETFDAVATTHHSSQGGDGYPDAVTSMGILSMQHFSSVHSDSYSRSPSQETMASPMSTTDIYSGTVPEPRRKKRKYESPRPEEGVQVRVQEPTSTQPHPRTPTHVQTPAQGMPDAPGPPQPQLQIHFEDAAFTMSQMDQMSLSQPHHPYTWGELNLQGG